LFLEKRLLDHVHEIGIYLCRLQPFVHGLRLRRRAIKNLTHNSIFWSKKVVPAQTILDWRAGDIDTSRLIAARTPLPLSHTRVPKIGISNSRLTFANCHDMAVMNWNMANMIANTDRQFQLNI
jgi:hypothetical protein